MSATNTIMRSQLFIPAISKRMLHKVFAIKAKDFPDAFIIDLEDSCPMDFKKEARKNAHDFLKLNWENQFKAFYDGKAKFHPLLTPRVNSEDDLFFDDVDAITSATKKIDCIVVGKVQTMEQMHKILGHFEKMEKKKGYDHEIKLIPTFETALGLMNCFEIMKAFKQRIFASCFGGDDYISDIGGFRKIDRKHVDDLKTGEKELFFARSHLSVASNACRIPLIDTPFPLFKDEDGLIAETEEVKSLGFRGKQAIHPDQVPVINSIFSFRPEEIDTASQVMKKWNSIKNSTKRGSIEHKGRMVDVPVIKTFGKVVDYAKLIEERDRVVFHFLQQRERENEKVLL